MTASRHERLAAWFEKVHELEGDARAAFLIRARTEDAALAEELERLLALDADEAAGTLARPAVVSLEDAVRAAIDDVREDRAGGPPMPTSIGPYDVVREIGRGGMGVVYEAEQKSPKRRVAVKMLRPDLVNEDLLRRFAQESQFLARLDHPGIAQVFEAGTVSGPHGDAPYLAMELVEGDTVTEYARREGLGIGARIELLAQIADAVDHAHRRGVVHRDLKPANVLVRADGRPKVLDFGVAMNVDAESHVSTMHTNIGEVIGTLSYMSPEQVGGRTDEVDARSDVYALGVLAHELLGGAPPFDLRGKLIHEAARIVTEDEPSTLGSLDNALRGDVERIVAKALEKEPVRRYGSAEALAADFRRHLADEPISATAPSLAYQSIKFAKRHRGFVIGLATTMAALLAGFITSTKLYLDSSRRGEALAKALEQERAALVESESVSTFVTDLLEAAQPDAEEGDTTVQTVLDRSAPEIDVAFADFPRAAARLHATVSESYGRLGLDDKALHHARRAHAIRAADPNCPPELRAASATDLGVVLSMKGELDEAETFLEEALAITRTPGGRAKALVKLAMNEKNRGNIGPARELLEEALTIAERHEIDPLTRIDALTQLSIARARTGELEAARTGFESVLAYRIEEEGEDHPLVLEARHNLATVLAMMGHDEEVLEIDLAILASRERLLGPLHPSTLTTRRSVGTSLSSLLRYEEAQPYLEDAVAGLMEIHGARHPETLTARGGLIQCIAVLGDASRARDEYKLAIKDAAAGLGEGHWVTILLVDNCGTVLRDLGEFDDAIAHHRRAIEAASKALGPSSSMAIDALGNLMSTYDLAGQPAEAIAAAEEAIRRAEASPESAPTMAATRERLMQLYLGAEPAELRDLDRIVELGAALANDPSSTPAGWAILADALAMLDRFDEAIAAMDRCLALATEDHPEYRTYVAYRKRLVSLK